MRVLDGDKLGSDMLIGNTFNDGPSSDTPLSEAVSNDTVLGADVVGDVTTAEDSANKDALA